MGRVKLRSDLLPFLGSIFCTVSMDNSFFMVDVVAILANPLM